MSLPYQDYLPSYHWARSKSVFILAIFLVFVLFSSFVTQSYDLTNISIPHARDFRLQQATIDSLPVHPGPYYTTRENNAKPEEVHLEGINLESRNAIATLLVGPDDDFDHEVEDRYFIQTRILAYQLLHAEETRSRDRTIPFIVAVTDRVPQWQRDRLQADGAIVVELPGLSADWLAVDGAIGLKTWVHVMTKLRLWELVDFERIAFVDADTLLNAPMDGLFDDPAVETQKTLTKKSEFIAGVDPHPVLENIAPLPLTYAFAGNPENTQDHNFPPHQEGHDWPNFNYLNAGFFVFKPDIVMLEHYISYLVINNSFSPWMPEQNLINHIHRRDGNVPWRQMNTTWNVHYPGMKDLEGGAVSIHEKWWNGDDSPFKSWMLSWRWRMEGFFQARDNLGF